MRKLCSVLCAHINILINFNNSLTINISLYDENFVPLHCHDKDGDGASARGKRFSHVHEKNLSRVGAKTPSE